ncbi:MAG: hypothetical protein MUE73_22005, partial [Planctomycetes bacterium]|nr:hypothetical protein [Planctomycetota bacterium]
MDRIAGVKDGPGPNSPDVPGEIRRLRRRWLAARGARLAGRAVFAGAVLLLAAVILRTILREVHGVEILRRPVLGAALAAVLTLAGFPLAIRLVLFLRRPALSAFSRDLDRRLGLDAVIASGLAAAGRSGALPAAAVARAVAVVRSPAGGALFPVRGSFLRTLAFVPLVLAAAYFLGLPSGTGLLPFGGEGAGRGAGSAAGPTETGRPETPETAESGGTPPVDPDPVLDVEVRLFPAKEEFEPDERVSLFLVASPGGDGAAGRRFAAFLTIDDTEAEVPGEIAVNPGEGGAAVEEWDPARIPALRAVLGPGKHTASARLTDATGSIVSAPVEFTIRGEEGGGAPPPPPPPEPPPPEPPP